MSGKTPDSCFFDTPVSGGYEISYAASFHPSIGLQQTAQSGEFDDLTIEAADITPDGARTDNGRLN